MDDMKSVNYLRKSPVPKVFTGHEDDIVKFFGTKNTVVNKEDNRLSGVYPIFLCFTNRCGSNSLAEDISKLDSCGLADEHLNSEAVISISKEKGFETFSDYLYWLFSSQQVKRPAVKASIDQLLFLYEIGVFDNLINSCKFVHAIRRDLLKQAVSFWIAIETNQWTSEQTGDVVEPRFNEKKILSILNNLGTSNARMSSFFSLIGADYIEVTYEDYISSRDSGVAGIANFLNVEPPIRGSDDSKKLKKQSSPINDEFVNRIRDAYAVKK